MRVIIDAENAVAGRLASRVARELLSNKTVAVINAEKAVISGNPAFTQEFFRQKTARGDPVRGPFYPRTPERILRRIIRGMLPRRQFRGKNAYNRLRVYTGVPPIFAGQTPVRIKDAENMLTSKYMTLGVLAQRLGAAKRW